MNDDGAIGANRRARKRLQALHAGEVQEHKHHIEPLAGQHQRPQRHGGRLRLHGCREAKMPGDHGRSTGRESEGHGSRESRNPMTSTNNNKPSTNDTDGLLLLILGDSLGERPQMQPHIAAIIRTRPLPGE
jgi:hypothetical protein